VQISFADFIAEIPCWPVWQHAVDE